MIHYHGTKISGGNFEQTALRGRHAMITFGSSPQYHALIAEIVHSFACDNGAYIHHKSSNGGDFPVQGFADWLDGLCWRPNFDFYCIPDCIGGNEHDNQKLRAHWFNTVPLSVWKKGWPVYHMHEPLAVLRDFIQAYPGVCLGSSGEYWEIGTPKWWGRMDEIMKVLTDEQRRPLIPIHGLRMLNASIFSHLPLRSGDSTNVGRHASDKKWKKMGLTINQAAIVMMDAVENHASASRWSLGQGITQNMELFG